MSDVDKKDLCACCYGTGLTDYGRKPSVIDLLDTIAELRQRVEDLICLLDEFDRYASETEYEGSPFQGKVRAALADSQRDGE